MPQFMDTETETVWPKPVKVTVIVEDADVGVLFRLEFDQAKRVTQTVRTVEPEWSGDPIYGNAAISPPCPEVIRAGIQLVPIPDPVDGTWAKIIIPDGSPLREKEGA